MFRKFHCLLHGGAKATIKLIAERYASSGMHAYIREKCRQYLTSQKPHNAEELL